MTIEKAVPSVYAKLGVRPVIHASGTTTRYGGSRMRPETIEAMRVAAQALVNEAAGGVLLATELQALTPTGPRTPGVSTPGVLTSSQGLRGDGADGDAGIGVGALATDHGLDGVHPR